VTGAETTAASCEVANSALRCRSVQSEAYGQFTIEDFGLRRNEAKKCEKMRFEATMLLKIKKVDLERTQIRSQFEAVLHAFSRQLASV